MQDLTLMVIDEGQQYGTDHEIATISLLKQQPSSFGQETHSKHQTGLLERPPTPRAHADSYWPRNLASERQNLLHTVNLAEAMIRLLDDSSNEGLHLLNQTLRNSEQ